MNAKNRSGGRVTVARSEFPCNVIGLDDETMLLRGSINAGLRPEGRRETVHLKRIDE